MPEVKISRRFADFTEAFPLFLVKSVRGLLSLLLTGSFEHRKIQLCGVGKTFKELICKTERSVCHIISINL